MIGGGTFVYGARVYGQKGTSEKNNKIKFKKK